MKHISSTKIKSQTRNKMSMDNTSNEANRNALTCGIVVFLVTAIVFCFMAVFYSGLSDFFARPTNDESITSIPTPFFTETLSVEEGAATPSPIVEINSHCPTWKNIRKDLSGTRYEVWSRFYENQIEWKEFRDKSPICNPVLEKDGYVFIEGKEYFLP